MKTNRTYFILLLAVIITGTSIGVASARISSVDVSNFAQNGYVNVKIDNIGNSEGTFVVTLDGDNSGQGVLSMTNGGNVYSNMYRVGADQVITIPVYISASTISSVDGVVYRYTDPTVTGRIKMYDYNQPDIRDGVEFTVVLPKPTPVETYYNLPAPTQKQTPGFDITLLIVSITAILTLKDPKRC